MPLYLYRCPQCEVEDYRSHPMDYPYGVVCQCGSWMIKKPQRTRVNWNGRKPSDGGVTEHVKRMANDAPRKRDEIDEMRGL